MNVASININLEKVDLDIDHIMSEIKPMFDSEQCNVHIPQNVVNSVDLESACKIFGLGNDK